MSKNGITEQVEDALTYPILTQQVDLQPSTASQAVPVSGGASLDSIAQNTIRRVLGWRYRVGDTKGFTAALTKTFTLKEVEGHVEWEWKPQNYMVQADLGEVTGAQASIYSRAKAAMDQALPLLDGLTPLREDADPEDCNAIRALVRSELQDQLVPELGKPGGPVVQLVEQIFTLLIGSTNPITDLETVGGQLGELRFRFGLERKRVNTVDEEVNLTNFLIVVDYINSLYITWLSQAKFLGRQGSAEPFLGTQLVLLSQQLEEVAESVSEAYDAMDSVFFGPAERQTTQLKLDNQPFITVAELLAWVDKFATVDGPKWLQDSGKDGVGLVASTAEQLYDLVRQASHKSKSPSSNPTRAFHTARVHRAFDVIRDGLQATVNLATQINLVDQPRPPKPVPAQGITNIVPSNYPQGTNPATLTIEGFGLTRVTDVLLEPAALNQNVLSTAANVQSDSELTAKFDLTIAQPGIYTLILKGLLGDPIASKYAFTVTAPLPAVDNVEPVTSDEEDLVRLKITGTGFQQNATVTLELEGSNRSPSGQIILLSSTEIVAEFDLSLVVEGDWGLVVTNPDGQQSTPPFSFPIVPTPPEIRTFVPRFGVEHQELDLTVRGCKFRPGMEVALLAQCEQTPIQCQKSTEVVGSNILKATFSGDDLTPAGKYYVIVTDQDGNILASSEDRLEVCPDDSYTAPTKTSAKAQVMQGPESASPFGQQGAKPIINRANLTLNEDSALATLAIEGSGFRPGAVVIVASGEPVREYLAEVRSNSARRIAAEFNLSQIMLPLDTVFVENPDGSTTERNPIDFAYPSPVVESFLPPFISLSKDLDLMIRGRYFQPGVQVWLQGKGLLPIKASKADILSPRTIRSRLSLTQPEMLPGLYQVVVINPDDLQDWSEEHLEILSSPKSTGAPIEQATTSSVSAIAAKGIDVGTSSQQAEPASSRESDGKAIPVPESQSSAPNVQEAANVQTTSDGPVAEEASNEGTSTHQVEPAKAEESATPIPEPQSTEPDIQEAADAPNKLRKHRTTRK
jgi:hypothetical protein